jgi:hypothetical protein
MIRPTNAIGVLTAAMLAIVATPAKAEVLDAVYRGTLVCDKLPFTKTKIRGAIDVKVVGSAAHYSHVVRLKTATIEAVPEQGFGIVIGQDIRLQGYWKGRDREYKAIYRGTFVRRAAKLKGSQTWTVGGKIITRACSGAIKRPLKVFLPRQKKPLR